MNKELAIKIVLSALMSVLTFAFVWGVYIAVLLITQNTSGDASYALSLVIALTVQFIAYNVSPRRLRRLQRWLGCAVGSLVIMLIFYKAFGEGDGNFKSLGGSFNLTLLIGMLGFTAVMGLWELVAHFLLHRPKNPSGDSDEADADNKQTAEE